MPFLYNPFTSNLDEVDDTSAFGDVSGPGSSTDNALVRWDGATGTLIKDSTAILDDGGNLTVESISLTTSLAIADGGTGASTDSGARTNLGLGTIATQAANNVAITGGSITGITDLAVADGGTGASDASTARTNLGLGTASTQNYTSSTWTPAITGSGSNPTVTYTSQIGVYTQIGSLVFAKAVITINTISGGSGNAQFSVPVTSASDSVTNVGDCSLAGVGFPTTTSWINFQLVTTSASGILRASRDNTTTSDVQISNLAAGDTIRYQLFYWA